MNKEIVIKTTKCLLVLYENELFQVLSLRPDIFEQAIKKGKGYCRAQAVEQRNKPKNKQPERTTKIIEGRCQ